MAIKSEIIDGVPTISGTTEELTGLANQVAEKYKSDIKELATQLVSGSNRITIKKAKINNMNYLEVEYEEMQELTDEAIRSEQSRKCYWDAHNDLKLQLDRLKPHLALLCELLEDGQLDDNFNHHSLIKYKVTGYVIGGSDEHEGVTLIGRKTLAGNRALNLVTPFIKWEDEHNGYEYAYELKQIIRDCEAEVLAYLNGKRAPKDQQELPFED